MKRVDPDRVKAAMAVIKAGGTLKAAGAAGGAMASSTVSRYAKKLGDERPPRNITRLTPEQKHRASATSEANRVGCSLEEVLQRWARGEAWCARCRAWLHRDNHNPSDCVRAFWRSQGLCACCGKPPRPGLKTCQKQADKSAAYQRAKTQRKRAAEGSGTP